MKPFLSLEFFLLIIVLVNWLTIVAIGLFYKPSGGIRPHNLQQQLQWERAHKLGRKKFIIRYGLLPGLFIASSGLVTAFVCAPALCAIELPTAYGAALVAGLLPAGPWWMYQVWHLAGHAEPHINAGSISER
jgi:hypothetical protein